MKQTFPIRDGDYEEWIASIDAHPILGPEHQRMREVYDRLCSGEHQSAPPDVRFGRLYQQVYEPSDYSVQVIDRYFRMAAARLKTFDKWVVGEHVPDDFLGKLDSESRVANTFSPIGLLESAFQQRGDDILSLRRRFEALPRYIISRLIFAVGEVESEVDVGEQAEDAFEQVIKSMFKANRSSRIFLRGWVDPANSMLCRQLAFGMTDYPLSSPRAGLEERTYETACRFLWGRKPRPVIFADRVKDDFSTVLKIIRKGQALVKQIDKRGFTIIAMTREDLDSLDASFAATMARPPFVIRERVSNLDLARRVDETNPYSSDDFRAIRYVLDFTEPRRGEVVPVEANLQMGQHFMDTLFSRTGARHKSYRLMQLCDQYFPFRFPRFICGVDFREGSADRERLFAGLR